MKTYHIHIKGQVQGVGFRPFVYRIAQKFGVGGEVYNGVDGVHIFFNANESKSREFHQALVNGAPAISCITSSTLLETPNHNFAEFRVVDSVPQGQHDVLLTPDFALCTDCRKELTSMIGTNRRAGYAFTTCTVCGPRYSIINRLPFDRENTSMRDYKMCASCENEYREPGDRRYFSQTNSCHTCGIGLLLTSTENELPETDYSQIVSKAVQLLDQGKIIAVKGIGGYLLMCDAANKESICKLRFYKQRSSKPFALMYPDVEMLRSDVLLSPMEEECLLSPPSPIVLLQLKENISSRICVPEIAPGLTQVGAMLPYAPVYVLLLSAFNKPVIATSANINSSPIIHRDSDIERLNKMANAIMSNNREIVVPQDDSVIKFSAFTSQKIIIRRSRGLSPTYINPELSLPSKNVLATGALLKSTFTLTHRQNIYISQYLGDLDDYDVQKNYKQCLNHFYRLLDTRPEIILTDRHPDYFSTNYGLDLAKELHVPVRNYQHHEAHFAAVLGENNLLHTNKPVLGVIWDGVGLGNDGHVWGGEFFIYKNYTMERSGHFGYFDYLLGDKMAREPRLSALAATREIEDVETLLRKKFSDTEWTNYQKILTNKGNLQTSSVGRIFDAVASLLDLSDSSSYEGEAAMYLETLAVQYFRRNGLIMSETYFEESNILETPTRKMFQRLIADIKNGKDKSFIAAKFHYSLATLVRDIASKLNIDSIALSGGVFQNGLLIDLIKQQINPEQNIFLHRQLSPNDECISFGQLCCYRIEDQRVKKFPLTNKEYVLSHTR